jgi:hypothetical protein
MDIHGAQLTRMLGILDERILGQLKIDRRVVNGEMSNDDSLQWVEETISNGITMDYMIARLVQEVLPARSCEMIQVIQAYLGINPFLASAYVLLDSSAMDPMWMTEPQGAKRNELVNRLVCVLEDQGFFYNKAPHCSRNVMRADYGHATHAAIPCLGPIKKFIVSKI